MVYIIGIGMDGGKTITAEGLSAIEKADIIIGAERMLKPFQAFKKTSFCSWKSDEIAELLRSEKFENAAVLMSGDCGFYSGAEKLVQLISDIDIEIICGISSPVYFCSKIKKSWHNMKFISLHGTDGNIVRNVRRNEFCFFLLGGNITPGHICRKLCEYGMGGVKIYIGENLSYENERILQGTAAELTELEFGTLTVAVAENPEYEHGTVSGISDENFIRGSVPMTKSEVRNTVISKLNIGRNDICWDIGCGTGSVSVEMAMQCFDGKVYSVDKNEEAVGLTRENALKFGCDNIEIISESAPNVLSVLPAPDRVFVGGSQGRIDEIFDIVFEKNSCAQIVVTAVSIETLNDAVSAFEKHGISCPDIVQLAVTRTKKVGVHTMLSAENPVFIIKGARL
ncbi:MAG: precorrin-6y C5,15-methyltransferase (decarboxylating) subunit CbiE [Oscillospiraceae bacterium]